MASIMDLLLIFVTYSASFFYLALASCSIQGSPFSTKAMSGTIKSPGYPNSYQRGEECDWNLNPPERTVPGILIVNIVNVDMNEDGPTVEGMCTNANTYVQIGLAQACGKEGPVCVGYLISSADIACHWKMAQKYPNCQPLLHSFWPMKVSFRTRFAAQRAGFHIDYEFVDCYDTEDNMTTAATAPENETLHPPKLLTSNFTQKTQPATSDVNVSIVPTTSETTQRTETTKPTETTKTTDTTNASILTTLHNLSTRTPEKIQDDDTVVLAVTLTLLILLLALAIAVIVMRKQVRKWIPCRKSDFRPQNRQTENGVPYSETYIIPNNAKDGYEIPITNGKAPIPPPYPPMLESGHDDKESNRRTSLNGPLTISNDVYEAIE